jgi:alanine dehydrogenase
LLKGAEMKIGVPKEIKVRECRVGLVPGSVRELTAHGHEVFIETAAGAGVGLSDEDYMRAGATILPTAAAVFETAEMIVKVKEPQPEECAMLREGQVLFTYLHLSADPVQAKGLIASKCVAIAYETVTDIRGGLPLLSPMSEVAGRMAIQVGAYCLQMNSGGPGILMGGVPGVEAARVTILGGGVVGVNAARMAVGMGAKVTVIDRSIARLQELDQVFDSKINTVYSTTENIERYISNSDLVIGAVLVPGANAPKLVTREMLKTMRKKSVLVDVAIDQGGCFETSHPTTHDDPTFMVDDIVHYCVANMPGAVARTSAFALNNATLPFVVLLANRGYQKAFKHNPHLLNGLNVYRGHITNEAVAEGVVQPYTPYEQLAF